MYNRYIPQPDGSYQRNRIPDPEQQPPGRPSQCDCPPENGPQEPSCPPPPPNRPGGQSHGNPTRQPRRPCPPPKQPPCQGPPKQGTGALQFFRQLLPRDFDTEDLLIILLLLLMAGDCKEDQNTALLTLSLYLFL